MASRTENAFKHMMGGVGIVCSGKKRCKDRKTIQRRSTEGLVIIHRRTLQWVRDRSCEWMLKMDRRDQSKDRAMVTTFQN